MVNDSAFCPIPGLPCTHELCVLGVLLFKFLLIYMEVVFSTKVADAVRGRLSARCNYVGLVGQNGELRDVGFGGAKSAVSNRGTPLIFASKVDPLRQIPPLVSATCVDFWREKVPK